MIEVHGECSVHLVNCLLELLYGLSLTFLQVFSYLGQIFFCELRIQAIHLLELLRVFFQKLINRGLVQLGLLIQLSCLVEHEQQIEVLIRFQLTDQVLIL